MTGSPPQNNTQETSGELNKPLWSVIGFDRCAASGLSYEEAHRLLQQLKSEKMTGLCIVTDKAAHRLCGTNNNHKPQSDNAPQNTFRETL